MGKLFMEHEIRFVRIFASNIARWGVMYGESVRRGSGEPHPPPRTQRGRNLDVNETSIYKKILEKLPKNKKKAVCI